jgi:hypothetical protein
MYFERTLEGNNYIIMFYSLESMHRLPVAKVMPMDCNGYFLDPPAILYIDQSMVTTLLICILDFMLSFGPMYRVEELFSCE